MKTIAKTLVYTILAGMLLTSCAEYEFKIYGEGPVVTQVLELDEFSSISMSGIDDLYLSYGSEQEITVKGHANIISRIEREVVNGTWYMELESGNYGQYDLTYYVTLPRIETLSATGTGDVIVNSPWSQDNLEVNLYGTGNFLGFPFTVKNCLVNITGTGNCEISVEDGLDVIIDGTGNVYYSGYPVINSNVTGTGSVISRN